MVGECSSGDTVSFAILSRKKINLGLYLLLFLINFSAIYYKSKCDYNCLMIVLKTCYCGD